MKLKAKKYNPQANSGVDYYRQLTALDSTTDEAE